MWCAVLPYAVKHSLCKFIKFYMLQTCALHVCVLVVIHENVCLVPKGLIRSFSGKSEQIFCWLFKWETVRPSNSASLSDAHACLSCTYSLPTLANWKGWGRHSCSNCWVMLPFNWSLPLNKAIVWTARETGAGLPETGVGAMAANKKRICGLSCCSARADLCSCILATRRTLPLLTLRFQFK